MQRALTGWAAHETHRNLPTVVAGELRKAGLQLIRQRAIPLVNTSYGDKSFSYWIAKFIAGYVRSRGVLNDEQVEAWVSEFASLEQRGEYFFSLTPMLAEAIRVT
jgi:hypothetical protein